MIQPKRFTIGQEVTPKSRPRRVEQLGQSQISLPFMYTVPRFGEVYTITHYELAIDGSGQWFVGLVGFKNTFNESFFCPIVTDEILAEELESVELECV